MCELSNIDCKSSNNFGTASTYLGLLGFSLRIGLFASHCHLWPDSIHSFPLRYLSDLLTKGKDRHFPILLSQGCGSETGRIRCFCMLWIWNRIRMADTVFKFFWIRISFRIKKFMDTDPVCPFRGIYCAKYYGQRGKK